MTTTARRDRLLGAALGAGGTVVLLVLGVVLLLLLTSDPAPATTGRSGPRSGPVPGLSGPGAAAPADLAADETWLGDLSMDVGTLTLQDSRLQDVRATAQGVRTGPGGTRVAELAVVATVPFDVVADELGGGSTVSAAEGAGQARVERGVELLGRRWQVSATGTVEARDGLIVVEPQEIDLGGPRALARAAGALARRLVTIEQPVEGLPDGLVLRDVGVGADGFRAQLDGSDVELAP